jgi:3-oxoacyl-[acyl-carrier protein] reductase
MSRTRPISMRLSAKDFHRLYGVKTIGPFQMIRAARSLLEARARR